MLRLEQIKKEGNKITAAFCPETEGVVGYVSIENGDPSSFQYEYIDPDEVWPGYPRHALDALVAMAKGEREIKDCCILWY